MHVSEICPAIAVCIYMCTLPLYPKSLHVSTLPLYPKPASSNAFYLW